MSTMTLHVEDFVGQSRRRAAGIPADASVAELLNDLSEQLGLPDQDAQGRAVVYGAQTAEGEALNGSDRVGDVLQDEETIMLTKTVTAG